MDIQEFTTLMQTVADGWMEQNAQKAADSFTDDAVYMQPPDRQLYIGKENLVKFFNGVTPGTKMTWHNLAINENIGFGEFTFEMSGQDHGVVVVELQDGKIKKWREYMWSGNLTYEEFLDTNKKFKWTV
jgi:hypothetical protein